MLEDERKTVFFVNLSELSKIFVAIEPIKLTVLADVWIGVVLALCLFLI